MEGFSLLLLLQLLLSIQKISSTAVDTITATQFIKDGESIVSSGGSFELGFFSPGSSKNRYVGIWYKNIPIRAVVWIANREIPLTNASGMLKVINPGVFVLVNGTDNIIWSSILPRSAQNPVAQLLESGNLVVRDASDDKPENFLWQSFDYPSDTLLPGMKLGRNFVTGLERYLSSWKSEDDPAPGDFTYHCDPSGYPQNILINGSIELFRSGPWNGLRFSGMPYLRPNFLYAYRLVFNEEEVYYRYELLNTSIVSRFMLNQYGVVQHWIWIARTQNWALYTTSPEDICDKFSICGAHATCNVGNSSLCECLKNFVPKYPEDWARGDWSNGCFRKKALNCHNGDGFVKLSGIKLPDTRKSWFDESMTLKECEMVCLKNCSCMAYANLDIRGEGNGCLLWFGDLLDVKEFYEGGQDMYVRIAFDSVSNNQKGKIIKVSLSILGGMVLLGVSLTLYIYKTKQNSYLKGKGRPGYDSEQNYASKKQAEDLELPCFGLSTIANATNNFSINNKLGQGGFGPVYKGVLGEGQEIAVKRLSKTSKQGLDEFKNEVICIAKLQHRNLVKLLGYCIQGDERMLIYEYMPHKSLDVIIFDETRSTLLKWPKRFDIINGIARGLLYLHQDSRLRIVHRDLKASNILLDLDMNPKISDFGLARSFGGNDTRANTKRVVGTYGYMSPEYAVDGIYSVKSDVFSFGVMVLEIVCGKRNRGFIHPDHHHNLLGHAWRLQKEDRSLELLATPLNDSCYRSELLRSIHVGLLCVQQCPEDRPSMSSVVFMLGNEVSLPKPKTPGFFTERSILEAECSSNINAACSYNDVTVTLLDAR